jgi:hypothetical protein
MASEDSAARVVSSRTARGPDVLLLFQRPFLLIARTGRIITAHTMGEYRRMHGCSSK